MVAGEIKSTRLICQEYSKRNAINAVHSGYIEGPRMSCSQVLACIDTSYYLRAASEMCSFINLEHILRVIAVRCLCFSFLDFIEKFDPKFSLRFILIVIFFNYCCFTDCKFESQFRVALNV
jgi:hypothetical protein